MSERIKTSLLFTAQEKAVIAELQDQVHAALGFRPSQTGLIMMGLRLLAQQYPAPVQGQEFEPAKMGRPKKTGE